MSIQNLIDGLSSPGDKAVLEQLEDISLYKRKLINPTIDEIAHFLRREGISGNYAPSLWGILKAEGVFRRGTGWKSIAVEFASFVKARNHV